ncbi:phosphopantetheine adenylyltransferase [Synergistales bacterium]|nr:phosphopantetheine adenylyltransferase [Synergistales bacterium]
MKHIRAVYPGSFDPITNGHIYIAERAAAVFDELEVSVLINPQKQSTFTMDERCEMAKESLAHLANVTVNHFGGLLVDYMKQRKAHVIIRGLRAMSDFEYEFQTALMNRQLSPDIETFFIVTDAQSSYISSNAVRDIYKFGAVVPDMVPPIVERRLIEKFHGAE